MQCKIGFGGLPVGGIPESDASPEYVHPVGCGAYRALRLERYAAIAPGELRGFDPFSHDPGPVGRVEQHDPPHLGRRPAYARITPPDCSILSVPLGRTETASPAGLKKIVCDTRAPPNR